MISVNKFLSSQDQKIKSDFIRQISSQPEEYLSELFSSKTKNGAYALSILSKKTTLTAKYLNEFESSADFFAKSNDPKMRKYAYIIAGNIFSDFCQKLLENAVECEQTHYTLPSLTLALGKNKRLASALMEKINGYKQEIAPKIFLEIEDAYQKINPPTVYECDKLNFEKEDFLVTTQKCYEDFLCKSLPYKKQKSKRGIICKGLSFKEFKDLCLRKDVYEVLLLCGEYNSDDAIKLALERLSGLVGEKAVGYRICCEDKRLADSFINSAKKLNFTNLINSPSNYSVTINFAVQEKISVCFKFENFKADFAYRTQFLPASINPVTANIIANIANFYNPTATAVYDPFCGSATMLIERKFVSPSVNLYGSDISKEAIEKARKNLFNANIKCLLSVKDIAEVKTTCNEIVSNLPYGLRVGSHSANEQIYKNLVRACRNCLTADGFAFLYTADKKLLRDLIKKSPLGLVKELPFVSGGLFCSLFIVKKDKRSIATSDLTLFYN